jgi:hypothetical protein
LDRSRITPGSEWQWPRTPTIVVRNSEYSDRARSVMPLTTYLRRNRRAFDVALACQGARSAAQSGAFPDRESKEAERLVAAIFSSTMREYSVSEHFPHAIKRLRRPTVSHDAQAISIIITGSEAGLRRVRLIISQRWPITTETASSDAARTSHAGGRCPCREVRGHDSSTRIDSTGFADPYAVHFG